MKARILSLELVNYFGQLLGARTRPESVPNALLENGLQRGKVFLPDAETGEIVEVNTGDARRRKGFAERQAKSQEQLLRLFHRAGIETDQAEQFAGSLSRCRWIDAVRDRSVSDDVADLAARIERGERILKNHLDAAALFAQRLSLDPGEIDVADTDGAGIRLDQPHDEACDR